MLKIGLSLIGNVLNLLGKSVLIPLKLIPVASATNTAIHKKMFGCGTTTLIVCNEEMNDIIKVIKSLEESGLLLKSLAKQLKIKQKNKKEVFKYVIRYFKC